jgi:hypothetical protein
MGRKISLADLAGEDVTVDLNGIEYKVLSVTRSVQKRLEAAQPLLENLEHEEDSDKVIETLSGALDAMLRPTKKGARPAAEVLVEAWQGDDLSLTQIGALFERVQEAAVARPTT